MGLGDFGPSSFVQDVDFCCCELLMPPFVAPPVESFRLTVVTILCLFFLCEVLIIPQNLKYESIVFPTKKYAAKEWWPSNWCTFDSL